MSYRRLLGDIPVWIPDDSRLVQAFQRPIAPIVLSDGSWVRASWTFQPPPATDLPPEKKRKEAEWRSQTFNTRGEEMYSKRTWMDAALNGRCLVPAESYTEHQWRNGGKVKVPYKMRFENQEGFCFAGLFKYYEDEDLYRFSIITMPPNNLQRWIHNAKPRQPVLLRDDQFSEFLDADTPDKMIKFLTPSDHDGVVAELSVGINGKSPENPPPPDSREDILLEPPTMVLK